MRGVHCLSRLQVGHELQGLKREAERHLPVKVEQDQLTVLQGKRCYVLIIVPWFVRSFVGCSLVVDSQASENGNSHGGIGETHLSNRLSHTALLPIFAHSK